MKIPAEDLAKIGLKQEDVCGACFSNEDCPNRVGEVVDLAGGDGLMKYMVAALFLSAVIDDDDEVPERVKTNPGLRFAWVAAGIEELGGSDVVIGKLSSKIKSTLGGAFKIEEKDPWGR